MIAGIGTDIVSIARIRSALARHDGRFARKVLANAELNILESVADKAAYVAKRFAAKEAFFKALGQPSGSTNTWHQLAILNDGAGRPRLEFGDELARLVQSVGVVAWHVSLSDEREHAVALIVLEKA